MAGFGQSYRKEMVPFPFNLAVPSLTHQFTNWKLSEKISQIEINNVNPKLKLTIYISSFVNVSIFNSIELNTVTLNYKAIINNTVSFYLQNVKMKEIIILTEFAEGRSTLSEEKRKHNFFFCTLDRILGHGLDIWCKTYLFRSLIFRLCNKFGCGFFS